VVLVAAVRQLRRQSTADAAQANESTVDKLRTETSRQALMAQQRERQEGDAGFGVDSRDSYAAVRLCRQAVMAQRRESRFLCRF
jgi:hypothetical protein